MDKRQIKEKLILYRPGSPDGRDPAMAEALRMARQDPELAQWLENHCASYLALRDKLRQIPVPANLREQILLENAGRVRIVPLWKPAVFLAAAAAILLLAAGLWSLLAAGDAFPALRDRVVRRAQRGYAMTMTSTNLAEIRGFLGARGWDADYALTKRLARLPGEGCATLEWHEKKISMVCFDLGHKQDLFLFVANRSGLHKTPPPNIPEFAAIHRRLTASWTAGDKVYILAGPENDMSEANLRQFLD